jgi:hypothetical protein
MSEADKPDLTIESTKRVRRAAATVERLEPPRPDEWITGEHYFGAHEDTAQRLLNATGIRSEDVAVQPLIQRRISRPRSAWERGARLAVALALLCLVTAFFFQALVQGAARLFDGGPPGWRAVEIRIDSDPPGASVIVGEQNRGRTPLSLVERCRGRSIRVRLEAPGYATWAWDGLCPARGPLALEARLQPQP